MRHDMHLYEKVNPFYSCHEFMENDIARSMWNPTFWEKLKWMFFARSFVQVNDGYAFEYKRLGDRYLLCKIEKL